MTRHILTTLSIAMTLACGQPTTPAAINEASTDIVPPGPDPFCDSVGQSPDGGWVWGRNLPGPSGGRETLLKVDLAEEVAPDQYRLEGRYYIDQWDQPCFTLLGIEEHSFVAFTEGNHLTAFDAEDPAIVDLRAVWTEDDQVIGEYQIWCDDVGPQHWISFRAFCTEGLP